MIYGIFVITWILKLKSFAGKVLQEWSLPKIKKKKKKKKRGSPVKDIIYGTTGLPLIQKNQSFTIHAMETIKQFH